MVRQCEGMGYSPVFHRMGKSCLWYCSEEVSREKLPMKALFILDNAPAHPPGLKDDILCKFKFVKFLYLPPNTTATLQPMDQQVISRFKKLYTKHLFCRRFEVTKNTNLTLQEFWKEHYNIVVCLRIIELAWQGFSRRIFNSAWKKVMAGCWRQGLERFEPETARVRSVKRTSCSLESRWVRR